MRKALLTPAIIIAFCFSGIIILKSQGIDSVLTTLQLAQSWEESIQKDSALAFGYNYMAEAYSGQEDSLASLYIDSLKWLLPISKWNKTEGLLFRAQGKYHDRRGEFQEALDDYSKAIISFEKNNDQSELIAYTYILKAFVLSNNGLEDACYQTLEQIKPLASRLTNKNYLAWILDSYGDHSFYTSFGHPDYNKALGYYLQVEQLLPEVRNMMIKADNAHGLAGCYLRLGQEKKAIEYRAKALEIAKANNLHSVIFAVYGDMADVYEQQNDFQKAIDYRLSGLDYAKQTGWIEMEARAHRTTAYTFKLAGNFEKALEHFELFKEIEDSLSRFEVQSQYHDLEAKYELGKKDLQIQSLKARNLQMWLYILAGLLLGGLIFINYTRSTNKKLRQHNDELFQKNLDIQKALTEGQNIERKRMAIELHDNINAKIAAAKWILETINTPDKSPEEQRVIHRLVDSMSDIYEDVRFISHNLVPKDIETKDLETLISQLVQNLNQNQKIKFTFSSSGQNPGMDNDMKIQTYAMIMELVNNIIRHSDCKQALIKLLFENQSILISVEDDGKGFDVNEIQSGTGLKNLNSRVKSVHGQMQVTSNRQEGVAVLITIPLAIPAV